MRKVELLVLIFIFLQLSVRAQNRDFSAEPFGFVSYGIIYDSYKSLASRDGETLYYPLRRELDKNGNDINSRNYLQMLSLQSRVGLKITGPEIGLAKTSAVFETDFDGTADSYVNMVRLRQAYIKLSWEKTDLILGQAYHPAIITECAPNPLTFGGGVPYHTLNRAVQTRLDYKISRHVNLGIAAVMASTHPSLGPRDAQRRSGLPEFHAKALFGSATKFLIGFAGGYKFLSVLDTTPSGYKTTERTGSYLLQAFTTLSLKNISFKSQVNYGTNLSHLCFIGGYGVKLVPEGSLNGGKDLEFTNLKTLTTWIDIETKYPKLNFGIYSGFSQNYGAEDDIDLSTPYMESLFYNRNAEVSYIFRVSPRIYVKNKNLQYGLEWGLNGAAYGTEFNSKRKATKTDDLVYNNRVLLLVKYNF